MAHDIRSIDPGPWRAAPLGDLKRYIAQCAEADGHFGAALARWKAKTGAHRLMTEPTSP